MAEATVQEQIVREAPEIEAYKLGLLKLAKERAETPVTIPTMRAAEMTPQQIRALELSGAGIGSYAPYMQAAGQAFTKAAEGYGGLPQYGQAGMQTAGTYGELAATLGAAGAQAYNPLQAIAYMNPYQEAVTRRAVEEMGRQAQIQQQMQQEHQAPLSPCS